MWQLAFPLSQSPSAEQTDFAVNMFYFGSDVKVGLAFLCYIITNEMLDKEECKLDPVSKVCEDEEIKKKKSLCKNAREKTA